MGLEEDIAEPFLVNLLAPFFHTAVDLTPIEFDHYLIIKGYRFGLLVLLSDVTQ